MILARVNRSIGRFVRNTAGNIMISTSIMALPLLGVVGVGIDMAETYRVKGAFQGAVDAAALAAAKTYAASGDVAQARAFGTDVFNANIANLSTASATFALDFGGPNGTGGDCAVDGITATASVSHQVFFDGIHKVFNTTDGHNNMDVMSKVHCGNDTIEVAMVLDNSGSMNSSSKLTTLKAAAKSLVATLHNTMSNSSRPQPIKFGIVPFAGSVNVGSSNKNAAWMDTQGRNPLHHEQFDWLTNPTAVYSGGYWQTAGGTPLTRFTLYDEMGINWAGCVEQRKHPYHTTDEPAVTSNPDSLYVPMFAPDTPDNLSGVREETVSEGSGQDYCVSWQWNWYYWMYLCETWNSGDTGWWNSEGLFANLYGPDYNTQTGEYLHAGGETVYGDIIAEEKYQNNYLKDIHNVPSGVQPLSPANTGTGPAQHSRQKWTWKYFNNPDPRDVNENSNSLPKVASYPGGPNFGCTTKPITPLTTSKNTVDTAINNMVALGLTNVQNGLAWGWRVLSSAAPFSEGRAESTADNKKIVILMTDGNNTYRPIDYYDGWGLTGYNGPYSTRNVSYYGTYGYQTNDRIFEAFDAISNPAHTNDTYRQAIDEHLLETCDNVKAAGIQIYSIAFSVPNGSSVKTMLEQCASESSLGSKQYYPAENNAELLAAFESIAEKIAALAISQ